jgi:hypothetical protein
MVWSLAAQAGPQLGVSRWDSPGNVDAFSQWLGRSVEIATSFTARYKGSDIESTGQLAIWSPWVKAKAGRNLSYAVSLAPQGGSLASCAAGQYDVHFRNLANNLASYGLRSAYLRLGWEMDGGWFPWTAKAGSGKEAFFAPCFRRAVQVMRQAQPANQWKFVFNPTVEAGGKSAWLESVWPGNAYVDVVGVDVYDQCWANNTYPYPSPCDAACRLKRQQACWSWQVSRLNTLRNFAIAHGKPMALPEWGVIIRSDGHGGGDNPHFIQKMHDFLVDPANKVVFHSYFNVSPRHGGFDTRLTDSGGSDVPGPTQFPDSAALFKQLFGTR